MHRAKAGTGWFCGRLANKLKEVRVTSAMPDATDSRTGNRTDLLVQSITDYALLLIDAEGIILTWNAGAELLFRAPVEELA